MTLNDLIENLLEMRDEQGIDGDTEVRLMTQQSWPFENTIYGLVHRDDIGKDDGEGEEGEEEGEDVGEKCVYILEGRQLGYGTKAAWESCRQFG